ncbi:sensor histidine kinase [Gordonia sp. CPCC 205333]|uniref:sensor histidine kinase n=1 Tax=Gordonia sp. CPCC 205333 TaxID=3140790 RepID=UPI003AF3CD22
MATSTMTAVPPELPLASKPRRPSPWQIIGGTPRRFLTSSDPWRGLAYAAVTVVVGWLLFFAYVVILLLPLAPAWSYLLGKIERQRVALLRVPSIGDPHPHLTGSITERAGARLGEAATWREVGYSLVLAAFAPLASLGLLIYGAFFGALLFSPLFASTDESINMGPWVVDSFAESWVLVLIAIPVGIVGLYLCGAVSAAFASLASGLLGPREEELAALVVSLQSSRGVLVTSFEGERRRIERDLHDGPQQDLVGASMQLGELAQATDDVQVRADIEAAQTRVERALSGLRDTVRGVYPQVLDDFGIEAACAELGGPIAVRVLPKAGWVSGRRLSADAERGMYYTASEAVTNTSKHGQASMVIIEFDAATSEAGEQIMMTITDDGVGGADVANGTGLAGLMERADALGATLTVTSPGGGPTVLRWVKVL